jgi:hypothetical protein
VKKQKSRTTQTICQYQPNLKPTTGGSTVAMNNQADSSTKDPSGESNPSQAVAGFRYSDYKISYFPDLNKPMKDNGELFLENLARSPIKIIFMFLSCATDEVLNICEEYMFDHKNINAKPMSYKKCAKNAASFLYHLLNKECDMDVVPFGIMGWIVSDGHFSGKELIRHLFENKVFIDCLGNIGIQLPKPRTYQLNIEDNIHKTKLMWDYVRESSANSVFKTCNHQSSVKEETQPNKSLKQENRVKEKKRPRSTSSYHGRSEEASTSAFNPEKRLREETDNPGRSEKHFKTEKGNPKTVAFKVQEQSGNREESNSKKRPYHGGKHSSA